MHATVNGRFVRENILVHSFSMETQRRVIPRCHLSSRTLLLTIALLATSWSAAKGAPVSLYLQAVFTPQSDGGLNHFLISNASGDTYVYVGALSMVYQLAPNLDVERNDTVSVCNPELDTCEEDPYPNDNKILAVAPDPINRLIMCRGSDGTCEFRFLNNLTVDKNVPSTALLFGQVTASQLNTPALVASLSEKFVLFAAASFALRDNRGTPPVPISFKLLDGPAPFNVLSQSNEFQEGNAVTYLNTFEWGGFIFVTVEEGNAMEKSRLGRICIDYIDNLDSYAEIPLSCGSFDTIQTGYLGTDDTFYALFTDGTQSALCSYGMQDIQDRFLDALCACVSSTCDPADGISYLKEPHCPNILPQSKDQLKAMGYECDTSGFYRYPSGTVALDGSMIRDGLRGEQASISVLIQGALKVAFITSTDGFLQKVNIQPDGTGVLYETVDLEVDNQVLSDVHIDGENEDIYILTEGELLKLDVVNCSQYTMCDECIGSSGGNDGDPFCGWCTLETKCSRSFECTTDWLAYNDTCIAIQDVSPPSQYIGAPSTNVTFTVESLPTIQEGSNFFCRFDDIQTEPVSQSGNTFTCITPPENQRPAITPEGKVTMLLGLYTDETDRVIVETEYPFFECQVSESCLPCVDNVFECHWCVYSATCTQDFSGCSNDIVVNNGVPQECPQLGTVEDRLLPNNMESEVMISGVNLPTDESRVTYRCLLDIQGEVKEVPVSSFDNTSVTCETSTYSYDSAEGGLELDVSFSVEYTAGAVLDANDTTVTLYDCSVLDTSCSSCVSEAVRPELGCKWCYGTESCLTDDSCPGESVVQRGQAVGCPVPAITMISPLSGPIEGNTTLTITGTDLGTDLAEINDITVNEVTCHTDYPDVIYEPGIRVDCMTGNSSVGQGTVSITLLLQNETRQATSTDEFMYKNPNPTSFEPTRGIADGGTVIKISGTDMDTGRDITAMIGDTECSVVQSSITPKYLKCVTNQTSQPSGNYSLVLSFDGAERPVDGLFVYLPNPVITDYNPKVSIMVGGIPITVTGSGFSSLQSAVMQLAYGNDVYRSDCDLSSGSDVEFTCVTPEVNSTVTERRRKRQTLVPILTFLLDGFTMEASRGFNYTKDPVYNDVGTVQLVSAGESLEIPGTNLNVPPDTTKFVRVCIGQGTCEVTTISATALSCLTPVEEPQPGTCLGVDDGGAGDDQNLIVRVQHGSNLRVEVGSVVYPTTDNIVFIIIGVVAGFIVLSVVVFLLAVLIGYRNYKSEIQRTEMEMANLMTHSKRTVMEGFFIDQEMTDVNEQLQGLGMPFVSSHDYMKSMLFFGLKVKPLTEDPENPSEMEERAMLEFSKLLSKKEFLMVFVRAIDECKDITTQDKANIASLLTVILVMEGKFKYFTDVLMSMMRETISDAADKKRLKHLFKRTETVEDKMLTNWIALAMFKFVKDSVGHPLYILYQAVKIQCEKGPVDAVTGQSYFSLSFDNLLTESKEFIELTLNVESEIGVEPVKVLSVDTITQVKEKILDAMYRKKHTKYQRNAKEVDLVIKSGGAGQLVLGDVDNTTRDAEGWCELNTLDHYGINTGAQVSLTNKQYRPNAMPIPLNEEVENLFYDATRQSRRVSGFHDLHNVDLEGGPSVEGLRYFHLTQALDQEEPESDGEACCGKLQRVLCFKASHGKREIREIYLQRLVSVKQSINNFVEGAVSAMFTIQEDLYANTINNVPFALRFLFNYFDEEASRYEDDKSVSTTWKNNTLPLRFWATIFAHPSFIFNMRQSRTADASIIVLNQMLDHACKGVVPKLKMNASPSRLLFNKELPRYIEMIQSYYHYIHETPTLQDEELRLECQRIDLEFGGLFSRLGTLKQLYDFVRPHEKKLVSALDEDDRCLAANFSATFQRVGNTLDENVD